jgi:membrane-bound lytic murein transglycosylase B
MRPFPLFCAALAAAALAFPSTAGAAREDFTSWLDAVVHEARSRGISKATIDASFDGVTPIERIIDLDRGQPRKPAEFCGYMRRRLTDTRISRGRDMLAEHRELLKQVSAKYGVPERFIVALWGLETNFGDYTGDYRVIDALATLAYDERRGPMFRKQLFAALHIVDQGHQQPERMTGSWAGAMGQVQFMPTTFLDFAVDHDGDGRKDVWTNLADSFASAAHYLKRSGWRSGETWGREVKLPSALRGDGASLKRKRSVDHWRAAGVRRIDGGALPSASMRGSVVLPDKNSARAFLVYSNFHTLLRWNNSTFFGISVGALADELSRAHSLRACR